MGERSWRSSWYSLIQGQGRPDITAKVHLIEVVPFVALLWVLMQLFGLSGAAWAWTGRVTADCLILLILGQFPVELLLRMAPAVAMMVACLLGAGVQCGNSGHDSVDCGGGGGVVHGSRSAGGAQLSAVCGATDGPSAVGEDPAARSGRTRRSSTAANLWMYHSRRCVSRASAAPYRPPGRARQGWRGDLRRRPAFGRGRPAGLDA